MASSPVNPTRLAVTAFLLGFVALVSQVVLLREMMVACTGNELSMGLVLAGWLLWGGVGSLAGSRLARRRGRKRAVVAVGHSILVIVYHIFNDGRTYRDLGRDFFDRQDPDRLTRHLVKRLEGQGHQVTLIPPQDAA